MIFCFLDDVQFTKGGYTNRTKLTQDNKYITVPLKHSSFKRICDLQISGQPVFMRNLQNH
ncbi:MAG: WbqC family protein [Saprospiraceae bacterium]|nr:WbqC family protein [Saprospiraceae bacterium]